MKVVIKHIESNEVIKEIQVKNASTATRVLIGVISNMNQDEYVASLEEE